MGCVKTGELRGFLDGRRRRRGARPDAATSGHLRDLPEELEMLRTQRVDRPIGHATCWNHAPCRGPEHNLELRSAGRGRTAEMGSPVTLLDEGN